MVFWTEWIGGVVRWLLKGCRTNYRDEIEGVLEPRILNSYEMENFIIGFITVAIIIILIVILIF
jgi:hypothetical protein